MAMENTKLTQRLAIVGKLVLLICLVQLMSCEGQVKDKAISSKVKIMTTEKFEIEKYNKCIEEREKNPLLDLSQCEDTLDDGTLVISSKSSDDYTVITTPPPPSLVQSFKRYYKNGFLQERSERYIGYAMGFDLIKFGNSLIYDQNGALIRTIDESEKYKSLFVKPLDLLEILKKEPLFKELSKEDQIHFKKIFNLSTKESNITATEVCNALHTYVVLDSKSDKDRRNVFVRLSEDKKVWHVTKDLYPHGLIELEVEATSGKIIKRTYNKETRP